MPMRSAVFYYGLDLPDPDKAARLRDTAIVLQPAHPLLTDGRFAACFPGCSLFVYWNPTGVQPEALRGAGEAVALLELDPAWDLIRLDLRSEATRRFAVRQGLRALRDSGSCVDGLFVDDLDLWSRGRRRAPAAAALALLNAEAGGDVGLFLNRGFAFWPKVADLRAVLLEELTPDVVDRLPDGGLDWVRRAVLPAVRRARRRDTGVFGLSYEPAAGGGPRGPEAAELAGLCDGITTACRSLDIWPEDLQ